ncbi:protein kinase activating protein dpb11 [Vanrija albida]|uniref:Protein kinase activating protein dpb11 n=1 Tax=Vanrija albida TaxID=181172 RepID=A0ABR3QA15_9TREE
MNRRGHLSHKVPNVKLRPAPERRSNRGRQTIPDSEILARALEEDDSDEDAAGPSIDNANKPWKHVTLTFTGVEDKPELVKLVRELGGNIESALTQTVNHVVAVGYTSQKYNYAVEHRIPVMAPSWIRDAHAKWIAGGELDFASSVESHRLQPFLGLKISITGIDQLDRRKQVIKLINEAGGVYSRDLDRSCTHLVSAYPTTDPKSKQSEKIKWAVKELGERAMLRRRGRRIDDADMCIVYESWIWDCVGFHGRWSEDAYDARKPRRDGRVRPEDVLDGSVFRPPEKEVLVEEEELQPAVARKRKRGGIDDLVGELLSTADPIVPTSTTPLTAPPSEQKPEVMEIDELPRRQTGAYDPQASVLHVTKSGAFDNPAAAGPSKLPKAEAPADDASRTSPVPLFHGLRFSHAIPDGYQGLENALRQHGGVTISEADRLAGAPVDYVIVRLSARFRPPIPEPPAGQKPPQVVTECWVEGCCFSQRLLSPDDNLVFQPLSFTAAIPEAAPLLVHISGFSTETNVYLRRLLRTIGGTLSERLNKQTTHLVCAAPAGLKYDKAREWGLTVVRDSWLWTMGRTGVMEPASAHAHDVHDPSATASARQTTNTTSSSGLDPSVTTPEGGVLRGTPGARPLKLTPTHIDVAMTDAEHANPLSPPKHATERILNRAILSPGRRTASAPESSPLGSPARGSSLKASATVGAAPGNRDDFTAALRKLAEDPAPQRSKVVRRARVSSTKSKAVATPTAGSPSTSPIKSPAKEPMLGVPPVPAEDESMRVTYADPVSEKERRRLVDAVMRSGPSPSKGSPSKRQKL